MTLKLKGSTDGSVSLSAPADTSPSGTDVTLTLPTSDGDANQVLQTDGSGALSWTTFPSDQGIVLQIAQDTDNTQRTNSTTTYSTCGPSVAFNIIKGSSKCLVHAYTNFHSAVGNSGRGGLRLRRTVGSTTTTVIESIESIADYGNSGTQVQGAGFTFLDTHGIGTVGTQVTYHLEFRSNGTGGNVAVNNNGSTIITVMEIDA